MRNRNITIGDRYKSSPTTDVKHWVVGSDKKWTLVLGKYAFVPFDKIPRSYLEWLCTQPISEEDISTINKYLCKRNQKN